MKIDKIPFSDKTAVFERASSMHDCDFTAALEGDTLIFTFEDLDRYCDDEPWFPEHKKLTAKFLHVGSLCLSLSRGRKEKDYFDTVEPLKDAELTMYTYSVDFEDNMTLEFHVLMKKKLWHGEISISPREIEYIWE